MRVLLFTGKGGVGKTTVAAATALACSQRGQRTIVLSTDPAHSLADAFDIALGDQPTPVVDGLWGQQLDAQQRMEDSWDELQDYLVEIFNWAGVAGIEAEELSVLPGLDEVFALSDIKSYVDDALWDTVVVDCAPTAETLRLLSLPDILSWYMDRVFPMGRRVNRLVGPLLDRVTDLPVAGDEVFGAAHRFYRRLDGIKDVLADTDLTSVRLVVNPERMVIAEARRTYTYLSLFGYAVDAVIANRLLPDEIDDPWFAEWKEVHRRHLLTIEEGFAPLPVLRAGLASSELIGIDALAGFAEHIYGERDPAERHHESVPLEIRRIDDGYVLELELPFADHDDLELGRRRDELLVRVGHHRRALMLPDSLARREVVDAALREGTLRVRFADRLTVAEPTTEPASHGEAG